MKQNKKIVFLAISSELGGAERSLLDLITQTQNSSSYKTVVILPSEGPLSKKLSQIDIETVVLPLPHFYEAISRKNKISFLIFLFLGLPSFLFYIFRLKLLLRQQTVHSIHSTGIKNHILCCLFSVFTTYHFFIHFRDFINSKALIHFFSLFSNKKNIHWMSASQAIIQNLKWNIPIFYDGLSEKVFYKNSSNSLKKRLGIPENSVLVAHAAALTPWKGQTIFIDAAAQILAPAASVRNNLHFVVIGSPIYKTNSGKTYDQELKKKVLDLKLKDRIHFLPFIENSREIYDGIDLFVHSSMQPEPFGRVILEALFCEKPVVAANAGGVLEILRLDSAKNSLHEPGNVESLVSAIKKELDNKSNHMFELVQDAKNRFQFELCYKRQVDYLSNPY